MTLYQRYLLTLLGTVIAFFAFLGLVIRYQWSYGALLVFAPLFVAGFIARNLTCPQCDVSITYGGRMAGLQRPRWPLDTHCNNCGCDLNK